MKAILILIAFVAFLPLQTDVEVKEYKYRIKPQDKYADPNRSYPTDTIKRDTIGRYYYEFWTGDDGINYGTKTRLKWTRKLN